MFGRTNPGQENMRIGSEILAALRQRIGDATAPATDETVSEAQKALGRTLPEDLIQIFQLADGGWGPGDGLAPLSEAVERYRKLCSEPFGPLDQPWPQDLFPLYEEDRVPISYNLASGRIIAWEGERIEDPGRAEDFDDSFIEEAKSLAELLDTWLNAETSEQTRERLWRETMEKINQRPTSPVTGTIIMYDNIEDQVAAEILLITEAEGLLEIYGLPETGWKEEIRRRHGLSDD